MTWRADYRRDHGTASYVANVVTVLLLMATIAINAFVLGEKSANNGLPNCQEDEVLYPRDYRGPGNNITTDYRCVHRDVLP